MESVSIWADGTGFFFIGFLFMAAFACLPAAAAFRAGKKGLGAGCLVLGLTGCGLFIPWIVAVVLASKQVSFQENERTGRFRKTGRILGIVILLYGVILLLMCLVSFGQVKGLAFEEFYVAVIINGLVGSGYVIVLGLVTAVCASARGRGFWGWYMAAPFLFVYGMFGGANHSPALRTIGMLLFPIVAAYIWWNVFQSVQREEGYEQHSAGNAAAAAVSGLAAAAQKASQYVRTARGAQGKIRCVSGQYAGAEFVLGDGEVLCLGSDPNLAHLVFPASVAAPLHMELTYQKEQGNYLLAHRQECPVFLDESGESLKEFRELPAETKIRFGIPAQVFLLL